MQNDSARTLNKLIQSSKGCLLEKREPEFSIDRNILPSWNGFRPLDFVSYISNECLINSLRRLVKQTFSGH